MVGENLILMLVKLLVYSKGFIILEEAVVPLELRSPKVTI